MNQPVLFSQPIACRPVPVDPKRTKHLHILNLGGGVQSTTLKLLANEGKLMDVSGNPIVFDCAIFADTQEEPTDPGENVYEHLQWLGDQGGCPILIGTAGKLGDDFTRHSSKGGKWFTSIPSFTLHPDGRPGLDRRQCTRNYKIDVIWKVIRQQVCKSKSIPRDTLIHNYVGISVDEISRMLKMQQRQRETPRLCQALHFPLVEQFGWTRDQCRVFLKDRVPHRVPRSACTFCPYHSNEEWSRLKSRNGEDWKRVVEVDRAIRTAGNISVRGKAQKFLHRACKPIDEIDFGTAPGDREMAGECEGMCGH